METFDDFFMKPSTPIKSEEILTFFVFMEKKVYILNMRIICISDTHSLHGKMYHNIPEGDILIHAGDCTNRGVKSEVEEFVNWFMNIKGFDCKIFIAGNHDFAFEKVNQPHHTGEYDWFHHLMNPENLSQSDVYYLEDSELIIERSEFSRPIKIWGTPWQPEFFNWAFNLPRDGKELDKKWGMIPSDSDIVITHSPPSRIRDFVNNKGYLESVGCELLLNRLKQITPALSVFGHIHNGYGPAVVNDTLYVNASICTESYIPTNKPIIVDLIEIDGKIIANYVEK